MTLNGMEDRVRDAAYERSGNDAKRKIRRKKDAFYLLPEVFYLPEGKKVAGGTWSGIHGASYRGRKSNI